MSNDAQTPVTTHDDGKNIRTALVVEPKGEGGSVALVDPEGRLLALVNVFHYPDTDPEHLIVDVIDNTEQWGERQMISFHDGARHFHDTGKVTSVDFRERKA